MNCYKSSRARIAMRVCVTREYLLHCRVMQRGLPKTLRTAP
jgi:hypothetical protein